MMRERGECRSASAGDRDERGVEEDSDEVLLDEPASDGGGDLSVETTAPLRRQRVPAPVRDFVPLPLVQVRNFEVVQRSLLGVPEAWRPSHCPFARTFQWHLCDVRLRGYRRRLVHNLPLPFAVKYPAFECERCMDTRHQLQEAQQNAKRATAPTLGLDGRPTKNEARRNPTFTIFNPHVAELGLPVRRRRPIHIFHIVMHLIVMSGGLHVLQMSNEGVCLEPVLAFVRPHSTRPMLVSDQFLVSTMTAYTQTCNMQAVHRFIRGCYQSAITTFQDRSRALQRAGFVEAQCETTGRQMAQKIAVQSADVLLHEHCAGPSPNSLWRLFDYVFQHQIEPAWLAMKANIITDAATTPDSCSVLRFDTTFRSASRVGEYRLKPPLIEALEPAFGPVTGASEWIVIAGRRFGTDASRISVTIGGRRTGKSVQLRYNISTKRQEIRTQLPASRTGVGEVAVVVCVQCGSASRPEERRSRSTLKFAYREHADKGGAFTAPSAHSIAGAPANASAPTNAAACTWRTWTPRADKEWTAFRACTVTVMDGTRRIIDTAIVPNDTFVQTAALVQPIFVARHTLALRTAQQLSAHAASAASDRVGPLNYLVPSQIVYVDNAVKLKGLYVTRWLDLHNGILPNVMLVMIHELCSLSKLWISSARTAKVLDTDVSDKELLTGLGMLRCRSFRNI